MDPNLAIGTTIDIGELTFKMRKDKAEEAYNLDHDIEVYKQKVADFMFPNANTSRRIKKPRILPPNLININLYLKK
jgi:hypothetical protein